MSDQFGSGVVYAVMDGSPCPTLSLPWWHGGTPRGYSPHPAAEHIINPRESVLLRLLDLGRLSRYGDSLRGRGKSERERGEGALFCVVCML